MSYKGLLVHLIVTLGKVLDAYKSMIRDGQETPENREPEKQHQTWVDGMAVYNRYKSLIPEKRRKNGNVATASIGDLEVHRGSPGSY